MNPGVQAHRVEKFLSQADHAESPSAVVRSVKPRPRLTAGCLFRFQHSAGGMVSTYTVGANVQASGSRMKFKPSSRMPAAMTAPVGRLRVVPQGHGPVALPPESREWEARLARQIRHQARIETAFDRVDACGRLGDLEGALDWLERAEELAGGLSPVYGAQRARWARQLARRQGLAAGAQKVRTDGLSGEERGRC